MLLALIFSSVQGANGDPYTQTVAGGYQVIYATAKDCTKMMSMRKEEEFMEEDLTGHKRAGFTRAKEREQ